MTRKTVELLIAIIAFATEVLAIIKEKLNGRKDDDKRTPKEKRKSGKSESPPG